MKSTIKNLTLAMVVAILATGCVGMETFDSWDSTPTGGFFSVTPSVDLTRTGDGNMYYGGCITSRILNVCEAGQSSLND